MTIRVLIADDHPVVRDGLRGMLTDSEDVEVVGEAGDGVETVALAERLRPDVLLLDLRMPRLSGVEVIRALQQRGCTVRVLVLTTFDTDVDVLPAVEAGATGYLLKDVSRAELLRGVRSTARGEIVLAPSAAAVLVNQMRGPDPIDLQQLSPRELEVLTLVAVGTTNRDIAEQLFIGEATVKTHLLHAFAKLGVNDRTAAVTVAIRRGILRLNG